MLYVSEILNMYMDMCVYVLNMYVLEIVTYTHIHIHV